MAGESFFSKFSAPSGDPLAAEHEAVALYVQQALASLGKESCWNDLALGSIPAGRVLLEAKPDQARRYLLAAVQQASHWEDVMKAVYRQRSETKSFVSDHNLPGWMEAFGPEHQTVQVVQALLRRALPLVKSDILAILNWCERSQANHRASVPAGVVTRAIERFASEHGVDDDIRPPLAAFGATLRESYDKNVKRFGTLVEQLCAGRESEEPATTAARQATPKPSPAGDPHVLVVLKQLLGIPGTHEVVSTTEIGPDRFSLRADSPLRTEHEKLNDLSRDVRAAPDRQGYDLRKLPSAGSIFDTDPVPRSGMLLAAAERSVHARLNRRSSSPLDNWQDWYVGHAAVNELLPSAVELTRDHLFDVLLYTAMFIDGWSKANEAHLRRIEAETERTPLSEGERFVLHLWRTSLVSGPPLGTSTPIVARLTRLIGDGAQFYLVPGEAWTDALNAYVGNSPAKAAWKALLIHALSATGSRPSAKWLKTAGKLIDDIGAKDVRAALPAWLAVMPKGGSVRKPGGRDLLHEENATCLRGLLWILPLLPDRDGLARVISAVGVSAYRKIPVVGARSMKVGNAAVYALSELGSTDAVGQLAMLKVRVKSATAQKEIEKAFVASAAALGLPRDQIEEMGVPSYGLEEVGRLEETLGEHRVELIVTGSDAEMRWFDAGGKRLKSVPASLKKDHAEELKEIQQSLKDIQAMLPAQRDRLDGLFLAQRSWPFAVWRERYLDHPLVGSIARRLIWCADGVAALFADGAATDVTGRPLAVADTATVSPWHPVGRAIEEVMAWRRRLEALGITQPFKQAHREIYLLTDAERRTATYSNRFAAHILRQHQFNALCAARGWKNQLRLMVDASYNPPSRDLPQWGLRAEFWIEGVGTTYGTDTNETGTYLRVATDQVRFYRLSAAARGAAPAELLALEAVPPLVFSEIMRDVDLFVGVGSVGNDPTWQDGGPGGRFRDYWQSYSFGELAASAKTRREVLESLVPRLKIAERCSFADRFLVVRGEKRTYKIHLGSGNILMEPNDQYLCIVPDQGARTSGEEGLHLPFEGDAMLSIILSKAFLLAADSKIKDASIVSQINR